MKTEKVEAIGFDAGMKLMAEGKGILYYGVDGQVQTFILDPNTKFTLVPNQEPQEEAPWRLPTPTDAFVSNGSR